MAFSKIASGGLDATLGDEARPNAKPIIINGDMQISQRATSVTGKTTSDFYIIDRMKNVMNNLGTWTIAQETLTSGNAFAAGFNKAFRMDCTTADASPASGDTQIFTTYLEGQDVQCLKKVLQMLKHIL